MPQTFLSIALINSILLFSIYLFVRKRQYHSTYFLIAGLFFYAGLELFDLLTLQQPEKFFLWKKCVLICESFLPLSFLSYSIFFAKKIRFKELTFFQKTTFCLSLFFLPIPFLSLPETMFFAPDFPQEKIIFLTDTGYFFYFGLLLYMVLTLANFEKNLFSLPVPERFRVKFEIVGAGLIIAMLIVYYSQGLLYRTLNMDLMPGRSIIVLLGVCLMFYSFARRGGLRKLYVSRNMAYRSVVILIVGCYFIVLGLTGQGMRYLGISSQNIFFYLVAFLGGLFFVVLLLSETLRRKFRVFLHKNFYQQKYDYRDQWLQFTTKISSKSDFNDLQDAILAFFCETFSIQGAALFLSDDDKKKFICQAAREMDIYDQGFPFENSLVKLLKGRDWVFSAREENPIISKENQAFFEKFEVSFIIPMTFEDRLEGFVVLGRWINPDEKVIYEDFDLMKVVARQAINNLMGSKLSQQLSAQREMAVIGKISTFVVHDLKNLVSSLGMMTENAREYINEPEFQQDMLDTLSGTVEKMKRLIARLRNLQEAGAMVEKSFDLKSVAAECAKTANGSGVLVEGEPVFVKGDPDELQKVILNLIINGVEASDKGTPVRVQVGENGQGLVRVTDNGCGMSEEFIRTRLFKPFERPKRRDSESAFTNAGILWRLMGAVSR